MCRICQEPIELRGADGVLRAQWTSAYINDLPDSSFAYIEPGGKKDKDGKTAPRSLRHLPYKDADGKLDEAHVKNALSRLPQTKLSDTAKASAKKKIVAAAKKLGIEVSEDDRSIAAYLARGAAMDPKVDAYLWAPITRIDQEKWEVEGVLTDEQIDTYGTVFSYERGKVAVEEWLGNVREQHDPKKPVGRRVSWVADDATRTITLRSRVSKACPDTWQKVCDGVLAGYSIGAYDAKAELREIGGRKNVPYYTDYKYAEISLVDAPSNPGAAASGLSIVRTANGAAALTAEAEHELDDLDAVQTPAEQRNDGAAAGEQIAVADVTSTETPAGETSAAPAAPAQPTPPGPPPGEAEVITEPVPVSREQMVAQLRNLQAQAAGRAIGGVAVATPQQAGEAVLAQAGKYTRQPAVADNTTTMSQDQLLELARAMGILDQDTTGEPEAAGAAPAPVAARSAAAPAAVAASIAAPAGSAAAPKAAAAPIMQTQASAAEHGLPAMPMHSLLTLDAQRAHQQARAVAASAADDLQDPITHTHTHIHGDEYGEAHQHAHSHQHADGTIHDHPHSHGHWHHDHYQLGEHEHEHLHQHDHEHFYRAVAGLDGKPTVQYGFKLFAPDFDPNKKPEAKAWDRGMETHGGDMPSSNGGTPAGTMGEAPAATADPHGSEQAGMLGAAPAAMAGDAGAGDTTPGTMGTPNTGTDGPTTEGDGGDDPFGRAQTPSEPRAAALHDAFDGTHQHLHTHDGNEHQHDHTHDGNADHGHSHDESDRAQAAELARAGASISASNRQGIHDGLEALLKVCAGAGCSQCQDMLDTLDGDDMDDADTEGEDEGTADDTRMIQTSLHADPALARRQARLARVHTAKTVRAVLADEMRAYAGLLANLRQQVARLSAAGTPDLKRIVSEQSDLRADVSAVKEAVEKIAKMPEATGPILRAVDKQLGTHPAAVLDASALRGGALGQQAALTMDDVQSLARAAAMGQLTQEQQLASAMAIISQGVPADRR